MRTAPRRPSSRPRPPRGWNATCDGAPSTEPPTANPSSTGVCSTPHCDATRNAPGSAWSTPARGRSARRQRGEIHGAPTLAIALACRVRAQVPLASALIAAERGFWWISVGGGQGNDRGWALWFRDPPPDSPDRGARSPEYGDEIAVLRAAEGPSWLASLEANPMARPLGGRDATPYLSGHLIDADRFPSLAVGDAAMAGDPLSGQGVFRALAMAAAASAALRTRLGRPGSKELAMRFYRERVQAMYSRESQKGLAFYRDEGRWPRAPFWTRRQQGPVDAAAARETAPRIERRPVAREGWVEEDRVLVTSAHPEGVWSYQGVPVAALLDARARSREELARRFSVEPGRIDEALAWLRHLGVEGGARVTGTHRPQTLAGIDGAASHPAE